MPLLLCRPALPARQKSSELVGFFFQSGQGRGGRVSAILNGWSGLRDDRMGRRGELKGRRESLKCRNWVFDDGDDGNARRKTTTAIGKKRQEAGCILLY